MLSQNEIVYYKGNKATILGFMEDNRVCIEIIEDCDNQFIVMYVDRNEIEQTKSC